MACQAQGPETGTKERKFQGMVAAPEMVFKGLDSGEFRVSDFIGKVVVLNFWATWCPPCRAEIPHLSDLYFAYKDKGVVVIGVSMDKAGVGHVRKFSENIGIPYPLAIGVFTDIERILSPLEGIPVVQDIRNAPEIGNGSVRVIPTTFIIDKGGNIYRKHVGARDREYLESEINGLLGLDAMEN